MSSGCASRPSGMVAATLCLLSSSIFPRLVGLAQFLPFVALFLPAGQAADRLDRGRIITVCLAINLLCALLLLAFTFAGLTVVWPVFAVLMLFGAARAFGMPASQAILINLVPVGSFPQAVALSSSAFHVAVIAGPVLGGLLYLAGPLVVYGVVAALLACSVLLMLATHGTRVVASREPASLRNVLDGLRFVFSRPIMLGAISLDMFAVLCLAVPRRCCPLWPTTCCRWTPPAWACCAARRRWARR